MQPKIIVLAGSLRKGSFNKKLAQAAHQMLHKAGADSTYLDLADYPMPLYDGDIEAEQGVGDTVKQLRKQFKQAHGFLMACPEYNSSISGVLKNMIDWVSRKDGDEPALIAFQGKIAGLVSTSPGVLGGLRGLVHVRQILGNIGCIVLPEQYAAGRAESLFDEQDKLIDEDAQKRVGLVVSRLVEVCRKVHA